MTGWLLDRTVLSELQKPRADRSVKSWSDRQPRMSFFLSTATIAAIRHYNERRYDSVLQTRLNIWIDQSVRPWFAGRIIPVTEDILMEWRRILGQSGGAGTALSPPDLLLVATARVHRLTICTRDHLVYLDVDAPVFNPWHG